jgi:hypothetical protein
MAIKYTEICSFRCLQKYTKIRILFHLANLAGRGNFFGRQLRRAAVTKPRNYYFLIFEEKNLSKEFFLDEKGHREINY